MLHMEKLISQAVEAVTSSLSQAASDHVSPIKVPIPHHPLHLLGPHYSSQKREDLPDPGSMPGSHDLQGTPQDQSSEPSTTSNREKTFLCPTCLKGFRSKQQLNQHSLVHTGIRKYECSYCDKAFKQLSHLQQHHRIHTGEKPYRCNQEGCDRAFAQLSNLQHHLRNHEDQVKKAGNKQFKCVICHRSYTNESSLKSHTLKMHIHIKPVDNPDDLNLHIKQRRKKSKPENLYNAPTMVPHDHQSHDRGLGSFSLALGLQDRSRLDSSTHSPLLGLGGLDSMRHDRMVQSPGADSHRNDKSSPGGSDKMMGGGGSVSFIELDDSGEVVSASVNRGHNLSLDQNHNLGLDRVGSLSHIMDRTNAHLLNRSSSHLGFDRRNLQSLSRGLNLVSQGMRIPDSGSPGYNSICTSASKQESFSSPISPSSHSTLSHHPDRLFSQSVHHLERSLSSPYPHMSLPTDRNPYPAHVNNISLPMDPMSLPVSSHTARQFHSQMPLSPRMPPMLSLPTSSHMTLPTTPQRLSDNMSFSPLVTYLRLFTINEGDLKYVEDFTYLGSVISNDNGAHKDIKARLNKARGAFSRLRQIWKNKSYSLKTKLKLYNSNVKTVLLYGSECWRVIQSDSKKIDAFHNTCLRRICNIYWPNTISNTDLYTKTGSISISTEIKTRRYRWLGHVFRMSPDSIPRTALTWTPPGRRKRGRPKTTWRRTVTAELEQMKTSLAEAQALAKDRVKWRKFVAALCSYRNEED